MNILLQHILSIITIVAMPFAWAGILWVAYHLTKYLEKTND